MHLSPRFKILIAQEALCGSLGRQRSGVLSNEKATKVDQSRRPFDGGVCLWPDADSRTRLVHSRGFWRFLTGQGPLYTPGGLVLFWLWRDSLLSEYLGQMSVECAYQCQGQS